MQDNDTQIVRFNFRGDELDVCREGLQVFVVVRRVCDALGISYQGQIEKLREHPAIGVRMILTPSAGGSQETACVELRALPLWLATIHPSKVSPELRDKLVAYQREAAEVLADHFFGPRPCARVPGSPTDFAAGLAEQLGAALGAGNVATAAAVHAALGALLGPKRGRPPAVRACPGDLADEQLGAFFASRPADEVIQAAEFYRQYREWATENGIKHIVSNHIFGRRVVASGFYDRHETTRGRLYRRRADPSRMN